MIQRFLLKKRMGNDIKLSNTDLKKKKNQKDFKITELLNENEKDEQNII